MVRWYHFSSEIYNRKGQKIMTQSSENTETPEVKGVQDQIETTEKKIEEQEEKVENASTPAEEKKAEEQLEVLRGQYAALLERLDAIDKRLAEPTVPAPAAKSEATPDPPKAEETPNASQTNEETKPRKRRLGAWG
jgi:tetrahydromethanopterin S-methyltransferase subunit G